MSSWVRVPSLASATTRALTLVGDGLLALCLELYVRVPRSLWGWIWRRPWSLGVRVRAVALPWMVVLLLVVAPAAFVSAWAPRASSGPAHRLAHQAAARLVRVERRALERIGSAVVGAWKAPARASDGPLGTFQRRLLVVFGALGTLFAAAVVFGGVVWVPLLAWDGADAAAVVKGRRLRVPSPGRFGIWRARADRRGTWFVGGSASSDGPLTIDPEERLTHAWVVGATGTGKTQSVLLPMLRSDILAGRAVVFIDGKGDRETRSALYRLAEGCGRGPDFRFFDLRRPAASCTYSPLLSGSANEQTDKIMDALRWDNEFFRSQSQAVLLRTLRALKAAGEPYTIDDLSAALSDPRAFRTLAQLVPERQWTSELEPIVSRWKEFQFETAGLRAQLDSLLMTDFGELLKAPRPTLDLAEAYRTRSIVYFALPVAKYRQTAPLLAKLIIGDLNSVAGMVQDGQLVREIASIVVDEFAAFAIPTFIDLLNKGRSAGMAITISHQSMRGDLASAGQGYVGQVADNTNVKICLRQSEDAEYVAGLSGTRAIVKLTHQTQTSFLWENPTGLGSARDADEYNVSPNVVRELPQGVAVVKVDQPERRLDVARLDFVDTSCFAPYDPPDQIREIEFGLDLRARASAASLPPMAAETRRRSRHFDGA